MGRVQKLDEKTRTRKFSGCMMDEVVWGEKVVNGGPQFM